MAVISANVQYNRGEHKLLDYTSLQNSYLTALDWTNDPNSNAAIGQYIYISNDWTDEETGKLYPKGPYIVESIKTIDASTKEVLTSGKLTPLSQSIAGEQDLSSVVAELKTTVGNAESGLVADVADLKEAMDNLPTTFVTDVKDASGNSVVGVDGVVTLGDYATKEDVSIGLAAKANASEVYTKGEVDGLIGQIPAAPFRSVADDDEILTLDENGVLKSDFTFNKETIEGAEYLVVRGKNNDVISKVATADFVVDGMLNKVEPIDGSAGWYRFTFNVDKDGDKTNDTIDVDFSEFIDVYAADNTTIELKDIKGVKTFNVKEGVFALDASVDASLSLKANVADVYNSSEVDILLGAKVDTSDYNAKVLEIDSSISAINTKLGNKADESTVVSALAGKVDVSAGYSLVEDSLITKLGNMEYIKSVEGNLTLTEGVLSVDLSGYALSATVDSSLATKLDSSAKVNGVSFDNGVVTIDAGDIKASEAFGTLKEGETTRDRYTTNDSVQSILSSLDSRIDSINTIFDETFEGVIVSVQGSNAIGVTTGTSPEISLKVADASDNVVSVESNGVYVPDMRSYWDEI